MTFCTRPQKNCPECGDELIHLANRGPHESSSAFGQYVHDRGESDKRWREMFWMDIDGAVRKNRTRVLRIFEHKPMSGVLSTGQKEVLPLLAKSLQLLASTGLIHPQSGVFVLRSDHPHDLMHVEQVKGWAYTATWPPIVLSGDLLHAFLCGDVIDDSTHGQAAA